jgi:acetylornithine deacetylase/succinyl-diaminopimelate desuccinylase-like protein
MGWRLALHPIVREVNGEQRIYARSASDDKAAVFAQLTAFDGLKAAGTPSRTNLRLVWEGEEESGSPHLEQILNANRNRVHGDSLAGMRRPGDPSSYSAVSFVAFSSFLLPPNGPR